MRKKLYKIVAIMMAASMMNMTVFAAENTSELTQSTEGENSGSGENYETPSSGNGESGDNGSGQEQSGSTGDDTGADTTNPDAAASDTSNSDGNGTGMDNPSDTADNAASTDSSTEADDAAANATSVEAANGTTTTSDDDDTSSDDSSEETRREASVESVNWSNGEIKDVMGIKATSDGETVTISYKTKHTSTWDNNYQQNPITITYADGTTQTLVFSWDGSTLTLDGWITIDGVTITKTSDQSDTEIAEISIPASWFSGADFTLSGGEYMTTVNGEVVEDTNSSSDAVYTGITLDGNFNDWDAVTKYTLNEPDGESAVEYVAWVIENDYVYIYIKDDGSNSATWAGTHHNGKYAITTDLGRTLVIQLTDDGAVTGADGAVAVHEGSQWEIAIPVSSLPQNNGGLSFGLYLSDSTLSGYGDTGNVGTVTDITYDGQYGDWDAYPHTEIQYATAGTQAEVPDGEAAIYYDNYIYGHCVTLLQEHLDEKGGEYTQAVTVAANKDTVANSWDSSDLHMMFVAVDSAGNINWNPQLSGLENGTYEFYIFDTSSWATSQNINNLVEADICYGKASITITDTRQDMEWYVDATKLAARYGIDETDLKTVSSQYGRIGQQWVTTAGASSGPLGSAVLCLLAVFVPYLTRKKFVLKK